MLEGIQRNKSDHIFLVEGRCTLWESNWAICVKIEDALVFLKSAILLLKIYPRKRNTRIVIAAFLVIINIWKQQPMYPLRGEWMNKL